MTDMAGPNTNEKEMKVKISRLSFLIPGGENVNPIVYGIIELLCTLQSGRGHPLYCSKTLQSKGVVGK